MPPNDHTPGSMLEIYMHALSNNTADEFLDSINMGVGNYTEPEYWQQVQAFRNGLFADSAMTQKIIERAKLETQRKLVDAIFDKEQHGRESHLLDGVDYPEPDDDEDKQEYFDEHAESIWDDLGYRTEGEQYTTQEHQAWLVNTCTGIGKNWTPPHWRMLKARHEASRSKGARLLDNLFGRPPEPDTMTGMEDFQ